MSSTLILVLDAAGRTGRLIVDAALRAGHDTIALVRDAERGGLGRRENLRVLEADARNAQALLDVIGPEYPIVCAIGPSGRNSNGLYTDVAEAVVAATARTGPHRFIAITSSGVRHDDPNHPWWYRAFLAPSCERPTTTCAP